MHLINNSKAIKQLVNNHAVHYRDVYYLIEIRYLLHFQTVVDLLSPFQSSFDLIV